MSATPFLLLAALAAFLALLTVGLTPSALRRSLFAAFIVGLAPLPALADAAAGTVHAVTLPKELYSAILDGLFLGISGLLAWAIRRGAAYLHIRRESLLVDRLEQGMTYALMYAREKLLEQDRDITLFHTRSDMAALAAGYLLPKMPGVLKELGIDGDGLNERLTARLDLVAPLSATLSVGARAGG